MKLSEQDYGAGIRGPVTSDLLLFYFLLALFDRRGNSGIECLTYFTGHMLHGVQRSP